MPRFAWLTDIHLNFIDHGKITEFCNQITATQADGVLITGDIAEAPSLSMLLTLLAEKLARPIYFVLGNHDYYRGRISKVRETMVELSASHSRLFWMPASDVIELSPDTALVGHDGWGDGRLGRYDTSPIVLNDFIVIRDLVGLDRPALLAALQQLGDEAASYLERAVSDALVRARRVVVLTHVPPFRESCWHEGAISDDDWLPFFTCHAVGQTLRDLMTRHPDRELVVLCGHTHSAGVARIAPNLEVRTGSAVYGAPAIQDVLEL